MSFLKSIISRRSFAPRPLICIYCLEEIQLYGDANKCPKCKHELPKQYLDYYREASPFFIHVIGRSQVGKTVFLQTLIFMLRKLNLIWPGFSYQPVDDSTQQYMQKIKSSLERGDMPEPTPRGAKDVYVILLKNMPRWGGRTLVIRDYAGEIFDKLTIPEEEIPFLKRTPTTFLMISPYDMKENTDGYTMDNLLESYINTTKKQGINFKRERRSIIVVFSKGDMIKDDLPSNLRDYLYKDPFWEAVDSRRVELMDDAEMRDYIQTLDPVSDAIQDWVQEEEAGKNLIRLATEEDIGLRFSIISSTGESVDDDGKLSRQLQPRRILDPYFWALEFQSNKN